METILQPKSEERPEPFHTFVERAAEGRNSVVRIILGTIIVVVVWFGGTFLILTGAVAAMQFGWLPAELFPNAAGIPYSDLIESPFGMVVAVATLAAIWPGVWLALRLVHKRRLSSAFGASGGIDRGDFMRAALVTLIVASVASILNLLFEPSSQRSAVTFGSWALTLVPIAIVLLVQTSAEEIFFRGYLLQSLAHRFRTWLVWGALPAVVFAFAHWSPDAQPWMNAAVIISILLFATAAVVLVVVTGNLGAAMGMHFANNVVALLFVSSSKPGQALSLFITPPVDDPRWTTVDAAMAVVLQAIMTGAILWLLASRRSPFFVGRRDVP